MTAILKVPACRINDTASCQRWDASGTCKAGVMSSHHWFLESLFKSLCHLVDATGSCISLLHGQIPGFGMAARATKWLSSGCKSRLGGVYKTWPMKTLLASSEVDYLLLQGSTFPSTPILVVDPPFWQVCLSKWESFRQANRGEKSENLWVIMVETPNQWSPSNLSLDTSNRKGRKPVTFPSHRTFPKLAWEMFVWYYSLMTYG